MKFLQMRDFIEYSEERFTKRVVFKEGDSTAFLLNFMPGQALPPHKHPGSHVFLQVVDGIGMFTLDGEELPVAKGDLVYCEGHEELAFSCNGNENTSIYVVLTKIPDARYAENV